MIDYYFMTYLLDIFGSCNGEMFLFCSSDSVRASVGKDSIHFCCQNSFALLKHRDTLKAFESLMFPVSVEGQRELQCRY